MRILIYESGLGNNSACIYKTDAYDINQYAIEAYHGKHADDIVFDKDDYDGCDIDLEEGLVYAGEGNRFRFDVAIDADELEEDEE